MKIDWWTLALQAVNALVLIWLLAHFLFRPVVKAIAARQKAAGQLLTDAKAAKAAAESERDKAAAETAGLTEHRSEALKAAEAEAATAKSALLAEAGAEADKLRAAAKAEISTPGAPRWQILRPRAGAGDAPFKLPRLRFRLGGSAGQPSATRTRRMLRCDNHDP